MKKQSKRDSGRMEPSRSMRMSTRLNSAFKWKQDKSVVGCLEVKSFPQLDPKVKLQEHSIFAVEEEFGACVDLWKKKKLQRTMIEAIEGIPPASNCCGLVPDVEGTIRKLVPLLNEGWAKKINAEYYKPKGYKLSAFVWTWSNVSGTADSVVLLIRFHSLGRTNRSA